MIIKALKVPREKSIFSFPPTTQVPTNWILPYLARDQHRCTSVFVNTYSNSSLCHNRILLYRAMKFISTKQTLFSEVSQWLTGRTGELLCFWLLVGMAKIIKFLSCISLLWTVKKIWQNLWNAVWWWQKSSLKNSYIPKSIMKRKHLTTKKSIPSYSYDNRTIWTSFSDLRTICQRS